jgi:hypothetical protein
LNAIHKAPIPQPIEYLLFQLSPITKFLSVGQLFVMWLSLTHLSLIQPSLTEIGIRTVNCLLAFNHLAVAYIAVSVSSLVKI